MSQAPSTFRVFGLVLLATLIGGLLFAQGETAEDKAAPASPSDKKVVAEEAKTAETPDVTSEVTSEAEVQSVATPSKAAPDAGPEPTPAPAAVTARVETDKQAAAESKANWQRVIASLTVFVLAVFVGFEVITKVPPTLHTPLMSGSNAISGITLVGAVIVAASMSFSGFVGFIAVALATINAVGGFMVTHRMLAMFKKR